MNKKEESLQFLWRISADLVLNCDLLTDSTKAVVSIKPDKQVFKGETVTLRCDMQAGGDTEWTYRWYKDDRLSSNRRTQEFTVSSVTESNGGKYTCRGDRTHDFQSSEISDAVTLTVSAATLTVSEIISIHTKSSFILYCLSVGVCPKSKAPNFTLWKCSLLLM
uniref:Ig-like domain-containing protein n=1 Tax=Pygocentrus nattereri TaxID=42514 RepID=A0AAR2LWB7_PYGNA